MPTSPSPAQSEASRQNGARSAGPATDAGKARSALNSVRHGLCGRTFFLLPDEDPEEFRGARGDVARRLARRATSHEQEAATAAIRAHVARDPRRPAGGARCWATCSPPMRIADEAERQAAKAAALRRWARCCATAAGSSASIGRPCATWATCASAASPRPEHDQSRTTERTRAGHAGRSPHRRRAVGRAGRTRAAPEPAPAPGLGGDGTAGASGAPAEPACKGQASYLAGPIASRPPT